MKCLFKYSVNTVLHSDIKRGQLGNKNRILYFRQDVKNVNISKVVYIWYHHINKHQTMDFFLKNHFVLSVYLDILLKGIVHPKKIKNLL